MSVTQTFPDTANVTTIDDVRCLYVTSGITRIFVSIQYECPNIRQWIREIDNDFGWDWVNEASLPSRIVNQLIVSLGSCVRAQRHLQTWVLDHAI